MCAALGRVLTIDKTVIIFTVQESVSESNLNICPGQVNDRIETLLIHILIKQINKSVPRNELIPVKVDHQSGVQIYIVFQHCIYIFRNEKVVAEHVFIGLEYNLNSVLLNCIFQRIVFYRSSVLKFNYLDLSFAYGPYHKFAGQSIYCFYSDTVKTH